jgi:type IV secretory pathway TrbL component
MVLAADYPFLNILWTMIIFFAWVAWIWILVTILIDVFRRRDESGWLKALWVVFLIVLPFIGVLSYLIINSSGMAERRAKDVREAQTQFDDYVRNVAGDSGGAAAEIDKAKKLLDSGAIDQAEFDSLKRKALA